MANFKIDHRTKKQSFYILKYADDTTLLGLIRKNYESTIKRGGGILSHIQAIAHIANL